MCTTGFGVHGVSPGAIDRGMEDTRWEQGVLGNRVPGNGAVVGTRWARVDREHKETPGDMGHRGLLSANEIDKKI